MKKLPVGNEYKKLVTQIERDDLRRNTNEFEVYGANLMSALDTLFEQSQGKTTSFQVWEEFCKLLKNPKELSLEDLKSSIEKMGESMRGEALYYACAISCELATETLLRAIKRTLIVARPLDPMGKKHFAERVFVTCLARLPPLECTILKLSDLKLTDSQLETLVKFAFPLLPNLEAIDLSSNRISDSGARQLANFLILNSTLTSIKLGNNSIGNEGAKYLKEALSQNQIIHHFDLTANPTDLADEVTQEIDANSVFNDVVAVNIGQSYQIDVINKKLSLSIVNVLTDQLQGEKVDRLSFYGCSGFSESLFSKLSKGLENLTNASTFDFTCCAMGDKNFEQLCSIMVKLPNLEKLRAAENKLTDKAAISLGSVLANENHLVEVDLEHNGITIEGILDLAKVLKKRGPQSLRFLFLGYNSINVDALRQLSLITSEMGIACDQHNIFGSSITLPDNKKKSQKMSLKKRFKFLLLGGPQVGKTALFTQFISNHFPEQGEFSPSQIEASRVKKIKVDDQEFSIELCDVDLEHFMDLVEYYTGDADGIIFCYNIAHEESFKTVSWIFNQIGNTVQYTPRILLGLQCDLEAKRKVLIRDGLELATQALRCPFFEVSARINYNVTDSFTQLARECLKKFDPKLGLQSALTHGIDLPRLEEDVSSPRREKGSLKASGTLSNSPDKKANYKEKLEQVLEEASQSVFANYSAGFTQHVSNLTTANILVVGPTGAGKSTIISSVFGNFVNPESDIGLPVTQNFSLYEKEGTPLRIFDSKGVETGFGQSKDFHQRTKDFLVYDPRGRDIHLIWYVINASSLRVQQSDKEFCELFQRESRDTIPVIFLLNHADQLTVTQKEKMMETVKNLKISNVVEVLPTYGISADKVHLPNIDHCSKCNAEGYIRKGIFHCDNGHKQSVVPDNGLDKLIDVTLKYFPQSAKQCFIQSQVHSLQLKKEGAKRTILNFMEKVYIEYKSFFVRREGIWKHLGEVMAQISVIFGFPLDHSKSDLHNVFKQGFSSSFKSSFSMFSKNHTSPALFGAIGILWSNRLLDISNRAIASSDKKEVTSFVENSTASFLFAKETIGLVLKSVSIPIFSSGSVSDKMLLLYESIEELLIPTHSNRDTASVFIPTKSGEMQHLGLDDDPGRKQHKRLEETLEKILKDSTQHELFFATWRQEYPLLDSHSIFLALCGHLVQATRTPDPEKQSKIFDLVLFWITRHSTEFQQPALLGYLTNFVGYANGVKLENRDALERLIRAENELVTNNSNPLNESQTSSSSAALSVGNSTSTDDTSFLGSGSSARSRRASMRVMRKGSRPPFPEEAEFSNNNKPFLLRYEPDMVARALSEGDHEAFRSVPVRAFLFNESKHSLTDFINRFTRTTAFFETLILQEKREDRRILVLDFVIKLMRSLANLNNFHSLLAAFTALNNSPISRLKRTWIGISPEAQKIYKAISELAHFANGAYVHIWKKIQTLSPDDPCVPHAGIYIGYTIRSMEQIQNIPDQKTRETKTQMLELTIIEEIGRFQRNHFPTLSLDTNGLDLVDFLTRLPAIDSDSKRFEMSMNLENRNSRHPKSHESIYWGKNLLNPNPRKSRELSAQQPASVSSSTTSSRLSQGLREFNPFDSSVSSASDPFKGTDPFASDDDPFKGEDPFATDSISSSITDNNNKNVPIIKKQEATYANIDPPQGKKASPASPTWNKVKPQSNRRINISEFKKETSKPRSNSNLIDFTDE